MIRSLAIAQEELGEHESSFMRAISLALEDFVVKHAHLRADYSLRTQSSLIHDYMRKRIREEFPDGNGVNYYLRRNQFMLGIDGHWTIKLKKLDARLRSKNIQTDAVLDFSSQQLTLKGGEAPTCVELGYQLLKEGEIRSALVWMVCPNGKRREWEWSLTGETGTGQSTVPIAGSPKTSGPSPLVTRKPVKEPLGRTTEQKRDA